MVSRTFVYCTEICNRHIAVHNISTGNVYKSEFLVDDPKLLAFPFDGRFPASDGNAVMEHFAAWALGITSANMRWLAGNQAVLHLSNAPMRYRNEDWSIMSIDSLTAVSRYSQSLSRLGKLCGFMF